MRSNAHASAATLFWMLSPMITPRTTPRSRSIAVPRTPSASAASRRPADRYSSARSCNPNPSSRTLPISCDVSIEAFACAIASSRPADEAEQPREHVAVVRHHRSLAELAELRVGEQAVFETVLERPDEEVRLAQAVVRERLALHVLAPQGGRQRLTVQVQSLAELTTAEPHRPGRVQEPGLHVAEADRASPFEGLGQERAALVVAIEEPQRVRDRREGPRLALGVPGLPSIDQGALVVADRVVEPPELLLRQPSGQPDLRPQAGVRRPGVHRPVEPRDRLLGGEHAEQALPGDQRVPPRPLAIAGEREVVRQDLGELLRPSRRALLQPRADDRRAPSPSAPSGCSRTRHHG